MNRLTRYDVKQKHYVRIVSRLAVDNTLGRLEDLLEKYEIEDLVELEIALDQYYHRYDKVETRRVLESMNRLTELIDIDGIKIKVSKERPLSNQGLGAILHKLYAFEDIEEKLGCPLEVVFKALMNGAYLEIIGNKVSDNDMVYHKNISINSSEIILQRTNDSCIVIHRKLTDYKKTWWLSETKDE